MRRIALLLAAAPALLAQQSQPLFNGKNLDGWEVRGESEWNVVDGTLIGSRRHPNPADPFGTWPVTKQEYGRWLYRQSWLYTTRDFGEFDLHVEYWVPPHGNSGVSIRDVSRAHYAIGEPDSAAPKLAVPTRSTPAHIGYEIQIIDEEQEKYPSGSIYLFTAAKRGIQQNGQWNSMDIESRNDRIRVKVNGELAAENPGDPARPKAGPIGLQLHDQFTFAMFRNIRIREVRPAGR